MSKRFLLAALERLIKTLGQVAVAIPIVVGLLNQALDSLGGKVTLVTVAGLLSAITSALSKLKGNPDSPSLVTAEA